MNTVIDKDTEVVLVSWVSVNHYSAPILMALNHPKSPLRSRVKSLYLCLRDVHKTEGTREHEATQRTIKELSSELGSNCPTIIKTPWKTKSSPTDHNAIRPFAEETLNLVRKENPDASIVIHLSPGTPAMHAVWLVLGTTGFIPGPVHLIQTADERSLASGQPAVQFIHFTIDSWLNRYRISRPEKIESDDNGQIWNPTTIKSQVLKKTIDKIQLWAPLRVPVLIIGERGTGKTTIANMLRSRSPFQKEGNTQWPRVVCGQFRVNPQLARSELFGHIRGAFTGATKDRKGLLEQADGDTLFLDEIADIDQDTQRLLMAAIEDRGFQRLGETKIRQSSFRLICATNHTIDELHSQILDSDFFDRIAMFILEVPPLRHCREDLPEAWRKVLVDAIKYTGIQPLGWDTFLDEPKVLDAILTSPLHGNFRDLQRAAYHLLASQNAGCSKEEVVASSITPLNKTQVKSDTKLDSNELQKLLPVANIREKFESYEFAWLEAAMDKAVNNKSEAARLLGMPRKTFENRWATLNEKKHQRNDQ